MISLAHFLHQCIDAELKELVRDNVQHLTFSTNMGLLLGPAKSGKTSWLFNYGYSKATDNQKVLFIGPKGKLDTSVPVFPEGFTPSDDVLAKIQMKTLTTDKELRYYLAHIHMQSFLPEVLIIDDISAFFSSSADRQAKLIFTLALLREATEYISSIISNNGQSKHQCTVLVSDIIYPDDNPNKFNQYDPWLPLILLIKGQHNPYTLSVHNVSKESDATQTYCEYTITNNELIVENLQLHLLESENTEEMDRIDI